MTLISDFSIVADSTATDSPPPSPKHAAAPAVKRTYGGRRRDTDLPPTEPAARSASPAARNTQSLYRTAPHDIDETIPPSSDGADVPESSEISRDTDMGVETDDDDDAQNTSPKFKFGWRERLNAIDDMPDTEINKLIANSKGNDASLSPPQAHDASFEDPFGGELSELTASSSQPAPQSSPIPAPTKRSHRVVPDSDDELDVATRPTNHSRVASSPTSPPYPDAINTPPRHSSPTPPTSDDEMPSAKAKGKAPMRDVAPLSFHQQDARDGSLPPAAKRPAVKGKEKEKRPKIKAPTKKERNETMLERQRLNADKRVTISRPVVEARHTISGLLKRVNEQAKPLKKLPSSDPIQPFSSPSIDDVVDRKEGSSSGFGAPIAGLLQSAPARLSVHMTPPPRTKLELNSDLEDSDEELVDMDVLLAEQRKKDEERQRQARDRALREAKQRILESQQNSAPADDDDDDLVIEDEMQGVAKEEAAERRHRAHPSAGRKMQMLLARVSPAKKRGAGDRGRAKGKAKTKVMDQAALLRQLKAQADRVAAAASKQKDEEWVKSGGTLVLQGDGEKKDLAEVIRELEKAREEMQEQGEEDGDEEGSDEEWTPDMRGSASPGPDEVEELVAEEDDAGEGSGNEAETENEMDAEADEDDATDKENFRPRVSRRVNNTVFDSDDENTSPSRGRQFGRVLVPDTSVVLRHSTSLPLDDGGDTETENEDKENDTSQMFDRSEDKENKAVVRHALGARPTLGSRGSLFGLEEDVRRSLSMSPGPGMLADDDDENTVPFKGLAKSALGDPFTFSPSPSRKGRSQATLLGEGPSQLPAPLVFNAEPLAFSQFSDDENDENRACAPRPQALQPGFSDLFESGTEQRSKSPGRALKDLRPGGLSQAFLSDEEEGGPGFDKLRRSENTQQFALTLDVGLQPALEVNENVRKQADNIFEKEQEYLLEAANRKPQKKPELYVNDHGFLTQTRPDVQSPEVYRVSPTQAATQRILQATQASSSASRHPLRTLSYSQELVLDESPIQRGRLRRLQKRSASPPSPTSRKSKPSPRNAFDLMKAAEARARKRAERPKNSEFVEDQAQESDDDEFLGFGRPRAKNDDDEEEGDGEDLDKTLEGLVDDEQMDEETQAVERVLEKVREHEELDDQELEKLHRAAIEGQFRVKRRDRGVGFDDDEDEDEDAADRARRRKMNKRRRIDGDNLEELGNSEETRAFYLAYKNDLVDDDDEFSNLQADVVMGEGDEQEDAEEEAPEEVSRDDIIQAVRARAEAKENGLYDEEEDFMDVHDVTWVDQDQDDELDVAVRTYQSKAKQPARRTGFMQTDFDGDAPETRRSTIENDQERLRMNKWAKTEGRTRHMNTGRNAVGAAVTGHSSKAKVGGGSLRTGPGQRVTVDASSSSRRPVMKAPSMLARVGSSKDRFA
ncbi:hypothetical protein PLICRDRAFT_694035 [Plicaturopsis crispa FD-325 SS-3]|nr:hypothetical protein PLICRDRAFT_694035 [Plicaturopsis crispa FD-325 SS-3]